MTCKRYNTALLKNQIYITGLCKKVFPNLSYFVTQYNFVPSPAHYVNIVGTVMRFFDNYPFVVLKKSTVATIIIDESFSVSKKELIQERFRHTHTFIPIFRGYKDPKGCYTLYTMNFLTLPKYHFDYSSQGLTITYELGLNKLSEYVTLYESQKLPSNIVHHERATKHSNHLDFMWAHTQLINYSVKLPVRTLNYVPPIEVLHNTKCFSNRETTRVLLRCIDPELLHYIVRLLKGLDVFINHFKIYPKKLDGTIDKDYSEYFSRMYKDIESPNCETYNIYSAIMRMVLLSSSDYTLTERDSLKLIKFDHYSMRLPDTKKVCLAMIFGWDVKRYKYIQPLHDFVVETIRYNISEHYYMHKENKEDTAKRTYINLNAYKSKLKSTMQKMYK